MEIKAIAEKLVWENFVTKQKDYTFLHSWNWGEIYSREGGKMWRFGLYEGTSLQGVCLALFIKARRGKFLFVPHGPIISDCTEEKLRAFIMRLVEVARREQCVFLRISPWMVSNDENKKMFSSLGFRSAPVLMHTEETWLINLEESEDKLMSNMRKTTRNLVRRAEKEEVEITRSNDSRDISLLDDLQQETAIRHHFVPFSKKNLETEFSIFAKDNESVLFIARHKGVAISVAMIVFYGKFAFYFHSGSKDTKVPASYLLQWEVMKEAKRRGASIYNLWGVSPENKPNHKWKGITFFKSGFGGYQQNYLHAQDYILSSRYWMTYLIEKLPRSLRARI